MAYASFLIIYIFLSGITYWQLLKWLLFEESLQLNQTKSSMKMLNQSGSCKLHIYHFLYNIGISELVHIESRPACRSQKHDKPRENVHSKLSQPFFGQTKQFQTPQLTYISS